MRNGMSLGPIDITTLQDSSCVARTEVDDAPLWFASAHALSANSDALVCAFLLHALKEERSLHLQDPIDEKLYENIPRIARIGRDWWQFGPPDIHAGTIKRPPAGGIGMFFTAGIDSFFTLLRNREHIDCLVNVHGFDITLSDEDRFARSAEAIKRVADELSIEAVFVRTNLREHKAFQSLSWPVTHIAALSSIAHLLSLRLRRVYIASSDVPPPHGSHPSLDCLWSSNAVELVNDEIGVSRLEKVEAIAHWPLVRKYLKVCWENRAKSLNCGECEKCVRTQAQLATFDVLEHFSTFPVGSLEKRIQALPAVAPHLAKQWVAIRDRARHAALRSAIDALLARSVRHDRILAIEGQLWQALSRMHLSSQGLRLLDSQLFGGLGRRSYYAILRRLQ